jgi:hypothetical protein
VGELANAFYDAARAGAAGDRSAETAESVDGVLAQVHARELRGRAGRLGQAVTEGDQLGVSLLEPLLHFAMVPRQEHDEDHGNDEKCRHCQNRQVSHRCFHDRLQARLR